MALGRKTGGRQKGTPNKENRELREMILEALSEVGGVNYLAEKAQSHPAPFLALIGRVLPMTVAGDASAPFAIRIVREIVDPKGDA